MKKRKIKIIRPSPYAYNIADYDENIKHLIGWPGYRISDNKSGLGYFETQAEWAHMQGVMIRWMMTGKFKTRNPIYLFLMTVIGLAQISPIILSLLSKETFPMIINITVFAPYALMGILLLINVIISILKCEKSESITG